MEVYVSVCGMCVWMRTEQNEMSSLAVCCMLSVRAQMLCLRDAHLKGSQVAIGLCRPTHFFAVDVVEFVMTYYT